MEWGVQGISNGGPEGVEVGDQRHHQHHNSECGPCSRGSIHSTISTRSEASTLTSRLSPTPPPHFLEGSSLNGGVHPQLQLIRSGNQPDSDDEPVNRSDATSSVNQPHLQRQLVVDVERNAGRGRKQGSVGLGNLRGSESKRKHANRRQPPPPSRRSRQPSSLFEIFEHLTQVVHLRHLHFASVRAPDPAKDYKNQSHRELVTNTKHRDSEENQFERDLRLLRQRYRERNGEAEADEEWLKQRSSNYSFDRNYSIGQSDSNSGSGSNYENDDEDEDEDEEMAYPDDVDAEKKRWSRWSFWFIVFFLACLTIKDVTKLVVEYVGNPKKADMAIIFNDTMTVPNITFCMSRAQAWSHFRINTTTDTPEKWDELVQAQLHNMTDRESFFSKQWDFRLVMESYNMIAAITSMEQETEVQTAAGTIQKFTSSPKFAVMRKNLAMWLNVLAERNITFDEWVQKTGKETLRRSIQRFQRTTYKEGEEVLKTGVRISWISQLQLCFQPEFDEANFKPIEDQGSFFTMVLSHNGEKLNGSQVDCMSIDFHGRPSSMSRLSGHKGEARDGYDDELCLGQRHETTVEVKARYKLLENNEEGKACKELDPGEDDEHDCQARCRLEFIRQLCKCTPPSLSYLVKDQDKELASSPLCNYSSCGAVDAQKTNYTDGGCSKGCRRNCIQLRYQINHERKGRNVRPDLTTVYLNWGSFEYLNFEQDWVWSVSSFIAAIGGAFGLWLGLSILSLIQGGNFLYSYCTAKVAEKKVKRGSATGSRAAEGKKTSKISANLYPPKESHVEGKEGEPVGGAKASVLAPRRNPLASPFKQSHHKVGREGHPPSRGCTEEWERAVHFQHSQFQETPPEYDEKK